MISAGFGQVIAGVARGAFGVTVSATVAGALVVVTAGPNSHWPVVCDWPIGGGGPFSVTSY